MKRIVVLLAVYVGICLCQDEVTAEDMQKWIRGRGTFLASMIDVSEKLDFNNQKVQRRQDALDALKYLLQIDFGQKYVLQLNETEYNYYLNQEVELPNICNPANYPTQVTKDASGNPLTSNFIDWDRLTSIVTGTKEMVSCWIKQVDQSMPIGQYQYYDTTDLPFLNPQQVSSFYKCTTKEALEQGKIPDDYIQPGDAYVDPAALMAVLTWGDTQRVDYGWLEFWVYLCSFGRQPKTHKYMTKDPDALKKYIEQSVERRRKQAVARNMMRIEKGVQDLTNKINNISSGKEAPTASVNGDKKETLKKRLRKHKTHKKKEDKEEPRDEHGYTETQKKLMIPLLKQLDKVLMQKQDLIRRIRSGAPIIDLETNRIVKTKRMLRKAKVFNKNKAKRNKVEAIIDDNQIDQKTVNKIANRMQLSKKSLDAAKVLAMIYEKANGKKLIKTLRKKKFRRMRQSRKE